MMSKRARSCRETTRILWSERCEAFVCEKCGKLIHYNFGFDDCPYCGRRVIHTDERGIQAPSMVMQWR